MSMRPLFAMAAALMLTPNMAEAQEMPKPAPEMSQIAFFEGSWTCQGKVAATPMGPAGDTQGSVEIKRDLNGFWQSGVVKSTMANMPPMEGRFHVTYDPGAKRFVMFWVDNMGGWAQSSASGLQGDTLTYEGDSHMGAMTMKSRDTFTRSGTGSLKHVSSANVDGKWMTMFEETCTKK